MIGKSNSSSKYDRPNCNVTGAGYFPVTEEDLNPDRIVGGMYARRNQFPFMAVVHRLLGRGMISQCGGTIISHRWVLTAGHCVADQPRQFLVVFGDIDKSRVGYNFYQGPGTSMMTDSGFLHPHFSPTINDVGLLYMPRDIPFGEAIQPIHLAGKDDTYESFNGRMGTVIGWGKDRSKSTGTRRLKYATIPIISNSKCSMTWGITSNKHICTAAGYKKDACQGDSGGPLIVLEDGVPVQIGIVSYGDASCPSSKPGVFSRVTGYIDWIQEATGIRF
ncbi:collagenase-like [Colletes gigas]|uniref:collagenase-like n=1 Tax=Colletes gigas TaxID=935657 RepID=UPI001C9A5F13|nr:collagenase-like [Colletes gigas]